MTDALSSNFGHCFVWGSDSAGQLCGLSRSEHHAASSLNDLLVREGDTGDTEKRKRVVLQPRPLVIDELFTSTDAGDGHTLLATAEGRVYSVGRGREGQLGHGASGPKADTSQLKLVRGLDGEMVSSVTCGALHSMCLTAAGRVYIWGLIHEGTQDERGGTSSGTDAEEAPEPDAQDAAAAGDAREMLGLGQHASETLMRIVRNSTERWLLAREDDHGDSAAEEHAPADRQTETSGIVHMGARRRPVDVPKLCTALSHVKIVQLAAGYGHNLALSRDGKVWGCGYNDRGQLGLGHRINCPDFTHVSALSDQAVTQVACGSQHSMARVRAPTGTARDLVFVWGNGALGQLGLGRKVTGRRTPQLLAALAELNVVDIAAGTNHSVAVTDAGHVWSWGHAEYGQMGSTSSVSTSDLVDAFHFYTPRQLAIDPEAHVVEAKCGSCFSVGRTINGRVYSWGWNGRGVLGHGKGFFSHAPLPVQAFGSVDTQAFTLATGNNHCLALVHAGATSSMQLRPLLDSGADFDLLLQPNGSSRVFRAHRVVVEARSRYLAGFLRAAEAAGPDSFTSILPESGDEAELDPNSLSAAATDGDSGRRVLSVMLDLEHCTPITLPALLVFLYTDRLEVAPHKTRELLLLARELGLDRLEGLSAAAIAPALHSKGELAVPEPTLALDLAKVVNSPQHADVRFCGAGFPDATTVLYGHRAVLCRFEYFRSLLSGRFRESQATGPTPTAAAAVTDVDISAVLADGVQPATFELLLRFLYTSAPTVVPVEDPNGTTELLAVAERFGVHRLVRLCESALVVAVEDADNAHECLPFALRYNLPRLSRHCKHILALQQPPTPPSPPSLSEDGKQEADEA